MTPVNSHAKAAVGSSLRYHCGAIAKLKSPFWLARKIAVVKLWTLRLLTRINIEKTC